MGRLWWRWSLRDLRRRWPLVVTIALVIGLGTGTYAALLSTSEWRRQSNDASFAQLHTHDVRVRLAAGSTVAEGTLQGLLRGLPHGGSVSAARERLVVPVQVVAPNGILASGELVGSALGAEVDGVSRAAGAALTAADDGAPKVVLERAFATGNRLPAGGELELSGGVRARYVGLGQSPEYFLISGGQGGLPFLSQKSYPVLFATLHTAQRLTGLSGRVNDLVLTVSDPAVLPAVRQDLQRALAGLDPPVSADLTGRRDLDSYRVLYDDIAGDEQLWRMIALLVLLGAGFAALNLTTRVVEAQRREIGIGMALGVPGRVLAVRPLLFGAQVALIGVGFGLAVGWAVGLPLRGVLTGMLPLPTWLTPFQPGVFGQAAALGFLIPFTAVAWPVWRAIRVQPVDAIRVGHLAARAQRGPRLPRALRLPGHTWQQIPLRNLLRTPRRTLLTGFGIAAAITTLVTTTGFLDTFNATLDASAAQTLRQAPDRVTVSLRGLQPADGALVAAVEALPQVAAASPGLLLPVTASNGGQSVELAAQVLAQDAPWTPALAAGTRTGGIVLARKAATDLGVRVGDSITLTHPRLAGQGLATTRSTVRVAGLHPDPIRVMAYLDPRTARIFALDGVTNLLTVTPAPGSNVDQVRHALLALPGIAAAQTARAQLDGMRSSLQEFLGILRVAAAVTLLLALLIAFNTASIGMDERTREHATMLAYGLPVRTVLAMATIETALLGALGTLAGIAGGYAVLRWLTVSTIPDVMPELGVTASLTTTTLIAAFLLGVTTVAAAPLLTLRRLRRTDVPSTLRVVE